MKGHEYIQDLIYIKQELISHEFILAIIGTGSMKSRPNVGTRPCELEVMHTTMSSTTFAVLSFLQCFGIFNTN